MLKWGNSSTTAAKGPVITPEFMVTLNTDQKRRQFLADMTRMTKLLQEFEELPEGCDEASLAAIKSKLMEISACMEEKFS